MRMKKIHFGVMVGTCAALAVWARAGTAAARARELGTKTFSTLGAPAAQAAFLEGEKDLHSFEFDEAAEAF